MSSPGIPDGLLDDGNTRYCVPTGDKNSQQKKKHDAMNQPNLNNTPSQKKLTVHSKYERNIPTRSPTSQNNVTVPAQPTKIPPTRSNNPVTNATVHGSPEVEPAGLKNYRLRQKSKDGAIGKFSNFSKTNFRKNCSEVKLLNGAKFTIEN